MGSEVYEEKNRSEPHGPRDGLAEGHGYETKVVTKYDKDGRLFSQKLVQIVKKICYQDQKNKRDRTEDNRDEQLPYEISIQYLQNCPLGIIR